MNDWVPFTFSLDFLSQWYHKAFAVVFIIFQLMVLVFLLALAARLAWSI